MFEITINDPDSKLGFLEMPIYEGDDELVHRSLIPGDYIAIWHDQEWDYPNTVDRKTVIRVTENQSEFVCVNCGEVVSDCECEVCLSYIPE